MFGSCRGLYILTPPERKKWAGVKELTMESGCDIGGEGVDKLVVELGRGFGERSQKEPPHESSRTEIKLMKEVHAS
jgi:hypothetical protein